MRTPPDGPPDLSDDDYRSLAALRLQIRRFLHFSEDAARTAGLEPQQHQLLLAVRAFDSPAGPTIGALADLLFIRHHSAVGLVDRLEDRGLVMRERSADDRREVRIHLTSAGRNVLRHLSEAHRAEMTSMGPVLVETLTGLLAGLRPATH